MLSSVGHFRFEAVTSMLIRGVLRSRLQIHPCFYRGIGTLYW